MFPVHAVSPDEFHSFPRVRGDVPLNKKPVAEIILFSPRARGCSFTRRGYRLYFLVFPACAGMFLQPEIFRSVAEGFPRVRGDVPFNLSAQNVICLFSPRARGCSF